MFRCKARSRLRRPRAFTGSTVGQYGGGGTLFDKISGRIHEVLTGKQIPDDVLADMQQLQNVIAGTARTKYQNGLKAVNQNYGANFTPVQMLTAPGAGAVGQVQVRDPRGGVHTFPTKLQPTGSRDCQASNERSAPPPAPGQTPGASQIMGVSAQPASTGWRNSVSRYADIATYEWRSQEKVRL